MENSQSSKTNAEFIDPIELAKLFKEEAALSPAKKAPSAPQSDDEEIDEDDLIDEAEQSYDEGFEDGLNSVEITKIAQDSLLEKREDTRSRIAILFTVLTFSVFVLIIFVSVIDGLARHVSIIENLERAIPLISGVFLGSLGFVVGYYFRSGDDK